MGIRFLIAATFVSLHIFNPKLPAQDDKSTILTLLKSRQTSSLDISGTLLQRQSETQDPGRPAVPTDNSLSKGSIRFKKQGGKYLIHTSVPEFDSETNEYRLSSTDLLLDGDRYTSYAINSSAAMPPLAVIDEPAKSIGNRLVTIEPIWLLFFPFDDKCFVDLNSLQLLPSNDPNTTVLGNQDVSIWYDKTMDYRPIKVQKSSLGQVTVSYEYLYNNSSTDGGLSDWQGYEIKVFDQHAKPVLSQKIIVESVSFEVIADNEFSISYLPGTIVKDMTTKSNLIIAADGRHNPLSQAAENALLSPANPPVKSRFLNFLLIPLLLLAVVGLLSIAVIKRRN